jgi:molecular chaperone HscB
VASPSTSDPFGLLGLPRKFDVDAATLERAFFERSKEVHADRFATAPAAERVAALSRSRALNDAYQLLRREATRAEYLLAQAGFTIGSNERVDPELLMEFLEERERLSEARVAGRLDEVEQLQVKMRARRADALGRVRELFAAAPVRFDDIKQQLILLRYVERYLDECDAALDD